MKERIKTMNKKWLLAGWITLLFYSLLMAWGKLPNFAFTLASNCFILIVLWAATEDKK